MMKRIRAWIGCGVLAVAVVAVLSLSAGRSTAQPAKVALEGFVVDQIRFDESMGPKKPTPQIPKDWQLVSVSNGDKRNSNNLWFQSPTGEIYMVQGFVDGGKFIMEPRVSRLDRK